VIHLLVAFAWPVGDTEEAVGNRQGRGFEAILDMVMGYHVVGEETVGHGGACWFSRTMKPGAVFVHYRGLAGREPNE
jgi:hypothetical protein